VELACLLAEILADDLIASGANAEAREPFILSALESKLTEARKARAAARLVYRYAKVIERLVQREPEAASAHRGRTA